MARYLEKLSGSLAALPQQMVNAAQLSVIATEKRMKYSMDPLSCPRDMDMYQDIITTKQYETNLKVVALQNAVVEQMLLIEQEPEQLPNICDSLSDAEENIQQAGDLMAQLSGDHQPFQDRLTTPPVSRS